MRIVSSFLVAAFIIVAAVGCGGLGGDTPTSITKSIYSQLQSGNYEKGIEVFTSYLDSDKTPTAEEKKQFIEGFSAKAKDTMDKKGGVKSFTIVNETISSDGISATVEAQVTYGNGKTEEEKLKFIKKDGQWKINLGK
jgi:hypothetical protein